MNVYIEVQCNDMLFFTINKHKKKKKKHKCIYEKLLQNFLMFEFLTPSSTKVNDSKVVH
jgi:hypothetical protein